MAMASAEKFDFSELKNSSPQAKSLIPFGQHLNKLIS